MGAPTGNKNATKNKAWADAINRALLADDGKKLRELAEKLVAVALSGDVSALREIGDRVDGRPTQPVSGPDGESLFGALVAGREELRKKIRG